MDKEHEKKFKDYEKIFTCFRTPTKQIILGILGNPENKEEDLTISNIHRTICNFFERKYDYKNTHKQIKQMEKIGLVKLKKMNQKQGKPVVVILTNKKMFENMMDIANSVVKINSND